MNTYKIWIILLLLVFVAEVLGSISDIESGLVFQSSILLLIAIFALFVAYERLRDSLAESLEASE